MTELTIVCKVAQERRRNAALWRNLWTILLWVFGAAIVVFKTLMPILSLITVLAVTACAGGQTSPPSAIAPTLTHTPSPTITSSPTPPTPTAEPTAAETTPSKTPSTTVGAPLHPLLAWTIADDGALFVLDATHRLLQLAPNDLTPLDRSSPLVPVVGSSISRTMWEPKDAVNLAADETRLFVGGGTLTQTLVLDRDTFDPIATLDKTGIMAVDPGNRLFMIAYARIPDEERSGNALWAYDLNDLGQTPELVIPPAAIQSSGSGPIDLDMVPESGQLYVHYLSSPGSSPRNSTGLVVYNTQPLTKTAYMSDPETGFTFLSPPAITEEGDRVFVTTHRNPLGYVSKLLVFDGQGELLESAESLDGVPVTDARGDWIYVLQERGLWVLRGDDLSLQSVLPFTTQAPADLLLSPDDQTLYLLGNGWLTALPVEELHALGVPPVAPWPRAWGEPILYAPTNFYDYTNVPAEGVQFANIEREVYRSDDGGHTWQLLPAFTYRQKAETVGWMIEALSVSPDYADDSTFVLRSGRPLYRSTDGGHTLETWTPRIAFTSDRDGDREIYTMDPEGRSLRQITDHPASDEAPAWSPAWTRIAFQSDRNGNWNIYSVRADCNPAQPDAARCDLRQLTDDQADDTLPAWSPDGQFIAFVSTRDGNPEIYIMESDGQNQIRLTINEAGDWRPAWLPDSEELVFVSDRGGSNDLYLTRVSGLHHAPFETEAALTIYPLTADPADNRDPAPRPTGTYPGIAFLSDRDGLMRTYILDPLSSVPVADRYRSDRAHAHPSWNAFGDNVIITLTDDGISNIYKFDTNSWGEIEEYVPLTDTYFFDGHPAGSPVWWEPDFEINWAEYWKHFESSE